MMARLRGRGARPITLVTRPRSQRAALRRLLPIRLASAHGLSDDRLSRMSDHER